MIEHMKGFDNDTGKAIPMDWEEFVSKPWAMKNRSLKDYQILEEMKQDPTHQKSFPCRSGLKFHEVMPCRFDPGSIPKDLVRVQNPVYELKRGGGGGGGEPTNTNNNTVVVVDEPYATILELRSDKIVNFLLEVGLIPDLRGYLAVRFEDLVANGTRTFLEQVGQMVFGNNGETSSFKLPPECQPQGPKPEMAMGRRQIPEGLRTWVEEHLVGHTERLLGYR
jgi:hypothetical protein